MASMALNSFNALLSCDVFELIVTYLTRREAMQLTAVCRDFKEMIFRGNYTYKARVIVVASESNKILDICPRTGHLLHCAYVQRKPRGKTEKLSSFWPTGVAISPYDGDFYVCQYKGESVLQFRGSDLSFCRVAATIPKGYRNPEGICFSKNCLYVASANGYIWRFVRAPDTGQYEPNSLSEPSHHIPWGWFDPFFFFDGLHIPWGMATGPDGNLYVAMEEGYQELKSVPLYKKTGSVIIIKLDEKGLFLDKEIFCGYMTGLPPDMFERFPEKFGRLGPRLFRPSGVCFDNEGNLYVTSLTNEVLMYQGPLGQKPGHFIRVAASWDFGSERRGVDALLPWDVKWLPGIHGISSEPVLLVTRHTDKRRKSNSRITIVCAETGKELHEVSPQAMRMGNMLAVE